MVDRVERTVPGDGAPGVAPPGWGLSLRGFPALKRWANNLCAYGAVKADKLRAYGAWQG